MDNEELFKDLIRINAIQAYVSLNLLYKEELASMGDLILTEKGRQSLKGVERDYMRIVEQISKIAAKYRREKDATWDETFGGFFKVER